MTIISPLAFAANPTAPSTLKGQCSNAPYSISKGESAANILETTEKEGEVTIITQVACKTYGMTDKEMYLPKLPDWSSKKINDKPPSPCWWPEILDLKKKGFVDLPDQSSMSVLCILCQDGMGKSDGVISLRRPFNCYYWGAHEQGNKHCNLVKQRCWEEDQITKGKRDKKNQSQLLGFFQSNGKKKKLPWETASSATEDGSGAVIDDNNLNQVNTDCVVSSKSLVSNNDSNLVDVACARSSSSLVSSNDPKQHQVACAGAFNSVSGKKKNDVSLVHQYVVIYPKNAKFK